MEQSGGPTRPEAGQPAVDGHETTVPSSTAENTEQAEAQTGTEEPSAAARIVQIRERIDEIDHALIALWQERAALSQEVGVTRMASGGTRLVLSREQAILERFRVALGSDGTQLALLLLRAGRGPL
ncbi:chorismate mutase [Micromonospora sp. WMMD964]|nr:MULTISPECIES: chorismate mutase [unclassified Micromonospora]WFE55145.1 chorismate mutase [Micromonospora sp. WMMD1155]WFF04473.1 chorismate mutase [Micromonospora sp. WMMD964]